MANGRPSHDLVDGRTDGPRGGRGTLSCHLTSAERTKTAKQQKAYFKLHLNEPLA